MVAKTPAVPSASADIRRILHPRSIAVVGASEDESKWGGRFMRYVRKHGADGIVYPINPRAASIFGLPAYASVADCPGPVDMAITLLPKERFAACVDDCVAKGVHSIVAITAGFAEAGEEGQRAQDAVVAQARAGGVRIIGPNCMGLMNTHHRLVATTAMVIGAIDHLPEGPIGIVSQSGALMGTMLARGVDMGAGFSSTISVGNQGDLEVNDFFEYLIEDPRTEAILLYIEQVRTPARFMALLARARHAGKPVLVLKAGRSAAGAQAVSSHTASLAGPYAVFEAVCRAQGAYLFESPFDMLQAAMLLLRKPGKSGKTRMTSGAIAVLSGSGGGNALLVDQLEGTGLSLASLSEDTRSRLVPYLGQLGATLPVDLASLSAHATRGSPLEEVLDLLMDDPGVGAGMLLMTTQPNMDFVAKAVVAAGLRTTKPLVFIHAASGVGQSARDLLKAQGYGYVESPHDGIALLRALNDQRRHPLATLQRLADVEAAPTLPPGYLNEAQARMLLQQHGIPVSRWQQAMTRDQCLEAGRAIGYPLVLKAISSVVVHKSDHGLVKIRLADEAALAQAFDGVQAAMVALKAPFEGVLVTEMVAVDYELIAGIKTDPDYGPMLLLGSGGVLVDLVQDTQLAPAPVSRDQAQAMVASLRCFPVLQGYRGRPGADLEELCDILVALSELAWMHRAQLSELDINPLALSQGRLLALDARASTV